MGNGGAQPDLSRRGNGLPELTMSSERLKQFEMKRDYCESERIYLAFYSWGERLFQAFMIGEVWRSAKNWRTKIVVRSAACKGVPSLATSLFNFSFISLRLFFFLFFVLSCFSVFFAVHAHSTKWMPWRIRSYWGDSLRCATKTGPRKIEP